jgi:hypothetical protein
MNDDPDALAKWYRKREFNEGERRERHAWQEVPDDAKLLNSWLDTLG